MYAYAYGTHAFGTAEHSPTIGSRDYGASLLDSRSLYIWKLETGNWNLEIGTGNGIWKLEIGKWKVKVESGNWNGTYRPPYLLVNVCFYACIHVIKTARGLRTFKVLSIA